MRAVVALAILAVLSAPAAARQDRIGVVVCAGLACAIIMPPPPWLIDDPQMAAGRRGHWPGRR